MADSDLIKLYSGRILALASAVPHLGRLDAPQGTAKKRSPLCGSTVTVDLALDNGRISDFRQDVKACALGKPPPRSSGSRSSAAPRMRSAPHATPSTPCSRTARPAPTGPFAELEVLAPARDYKNRHPSILLAFDATLAAIEAARAPCP